MMMSSKLAAAEGTATADQLLTTRWDCGCGKWVSTKSQIHHSTCAKYHSVLSVSHRSTFTAILVYRDAGWRLTEVIRNTISYSAAQNSRWTFCSFGSLIKQEATLSQRWPRDAPNIWKPWK